MRANTRLASCADPRRRKRCATTSRLLPCRRRFKRGSCGAAGARGRISWPCCKRLPTAAPLCLPRQPAPAKLGRLPAEPGSTIQCPARTGGADHPYPLHLAAQGADHRRRAQPADPAAEMDLASRVETRTGDTSLARKARQRARPPDILLTTPEQVALLLSHADAPRFAGLETVILDELHALAPTKRGDLLALDLARLTALAPGHRRIGLSATVARPSELRAYLVPQPGDGTTRLADLVVAEGVRGPRSVSWKRSSRCPGPATPPAMRWPRSTPPSRRTSCRWCSSTPQPGRADVPGAVAGQR